MRGATLQCSVWRLHRKHACINWSVSIWVSIDFLNLWLVRRNGRVKVKSYQYLPGSHKCGKKGMVNQTFHDTKLQRNIYSLQELGSSLLHVFQNIWNVQDLNVIEKRILNSIFQKCYFTIVETITIAFHISNKTVSRKWDWVEEEVRCSQMQQGKLLYVLAKRPVNRTCWTLLHISPNNVKRFGWLINWI